MRPKVHHGSADMTLIPWLGFIAKVEGTLEGGSRVCADNLRLGVCWRMVYAVDMHVTRKAFDRMVESAIASLPEAYAQWLEEVPVIVEDRPSAADLRRLDREEDEGEPLGMYIGNKLEEGEVAGELPARVMLYRVPLMEACASQEQLAEEIRRTLLHELGHHAGMDEEDLDRHGMGDMEEDEMDWDVEA
jgi:predicted Zn-dependent protease with MMP-like domain